MYVLSYARCLCAALWHVIADWLAFAGFPSYDARPYRSESRACGPQGRKIGCSICTHLLSVQWTLAQSRVHDWCVCCWVGLHSGDEFTLIVHSLTGCDTCDDWFHDTCVGLTIPVARKLRQFQCPRCCLKESKVYPYSPTVLDDPRLAYHIVHADDDKKLYFASATAAASGEDNKPKPGRPVLLVSFALGLVV